MAGKTFVWGLPMAGATLAVIIAACSGADPIVYTDRVPYEWELWARDAGADGDAADDGAADAGATVPGPVTERTVFPPDHFWNKDVSNDPVDPKGPRYIDAIGADLPLRAAFGPGDGIPVNYVPATHRKTPVEFRWADESDHGPYPIPDNPLIETGPDKHILMIDRDNWILYELFYARFEGGKWKADCGAIFDLKSHKGRPVGWTSADAAGLAVYPGLVRGDEVFDRKVIAHALRFTVKSTQRGYVHPATHYASDKRDPNLPPMGMWVRLKASVAIDGFSANNQVILRALKKHGMILADNGSNWFISGAPDPRWNVHELKELERVKGRDFEMIKTGDVVTR